MTQDDIIRMAREAGWPDSLVAPIIMAKLAEIIKVAQAAEREALASEAEKNGNTILALQIRARGKQ